jgi:TatD DNase family protein
LDFLKNELEQQINLSQKIVAIGECGIDIPSWQKQRSLEDQVKVFKFQIELSIKYKLPLIIHNRHAGEKIIELIENCKLKNENCSGVFHCFTGSKKMVSKILELQTFYFGLGGLITTDLGLQEVVKNIPLEKIILETDSPYLTPKPIKDTHSWPNQPGNLIYIAQKLAELKHISIDTVAQQTTFNASKLFTGLTRFQGEVKR